MPAADAQQLQALVNAVRRGDERRLAIAVRAEPVWTGPAVLDGPTMVHVVPCGSPLAVREALAIHERAVHDEVLVMLTSCSDGELGPDVVARLAKGRVVSLDPFAAVLGLFRATVLDPALTRSERWLVDELIELAPAGGWPRDLLIPGVLDIDTAWRAWHRQRLGVSSIPETLADVFTIAQVPGVPARLAGLDAVKRASLANRWAGGGQPVGVIVELIANGRAGDVVPLGLVAGVLWAPTDDASLAQDQVLGRVRLEPVLGRDLLDRRAAQAWADAAVAALDRTGAGLAWMDRAEALLADAAVPGLAVLSDQLGSGFELRLDRLAQRLNTRDVSGAETELAALVRHRQGVRRSRRLGAATAAVRLLRRPAQAPSTTLAQHVLGYAADGAWVEGARRLLAEGDQPADVAAAFGSICEAAVGELRANDEAFAETLATWSASEPVLDESIVPVEHLIDRVVAPIAANTTVILLVCDGMAMSVAHNLLVDIADEGWTPAAPQDVAAWPIGLAMLPTVTEVSRASLLSGARVEGGQPEERNGFTNHPALRTVSAGQKAPVLFHKKQLVGPAGTALSSEVRNAILDPAQRVIGIVINSVDDHLSRGDQIPVDWRLEALGPLPWVLDAAAEAGRVVVMTADHGHVVHGEGARVRQRLGGGERWRPVGGDVEGDEIEVHGPRVLKGGRVVVAVDDRLRYTGVGHGYHGGATLHEVVVPVAVLARVLPEGWVRRPLVPPSWWTGYTPVAAQPVVAVAPAPKPSKRVTTGQAELFETLPAAESVAVSWVGQLLASPVFVAQRQRVRLPRPMDDDKLDRYLSAIAGNGGSIELPALATRLGEPADQLRMALTLVQRLVNVDGAEVLTVRGGATVELNIELLRLQFEVTVP
jgi:hypothetical protein